MNDPLLDRGRRAGFTLTEAGQYERALPYLATALEREPDSAALLCALATCHRMLGRPYEALTAADAALARRPEHIDALVQRSNALVDLNRGRAAIVTYLAALALAPGQPAVYGAGGRAYSSIGEYEKALDLWSRAAELAPFNPAWFTNLAHAAIGLNRPRLAAEYASQALALSPNDPIALQNYSVALRAIGMPGERRRAAYAAASANPHSRPLGAELSRWTHVLSNNAAFVLWVFVSTGAIVRLLKTGTAGGILAAVAILVLAVIVPDAVTWAGASRFEPEMCSFVRHQIENRWTRDSIRTAHRRLRRAPVKLRLVVITALVVGAAAMIPRWHESTGPSPSLPPAGTVLTVPPYGSASTEVSP